MDVDIIIDILFRRNRKKGKYSEKENIFFAGRKENQRRKRRKIFGEDLSRILRSLGFGLETCQLFGGFRYRFWRIWSRRKVSVSENLVSEKKSLFRFQRIWSRKKSLGFSFREFGLGKKVSVSVKILVSSFSGFEKILMRKRLSSGQKCFLRPHFPLIRGIFVEMVLYLRFGHWKCPNWEWGKGHFQLLKWPSPHSRFGHFRCLKRKSKTTSEYKHTSN